MHLEDGKLYSFNYLYKGAPKGWLVVYPESASDIPKLAKRKLLKIEISID
jgi:hypothetical protein